MSDSDFVVSLSKAKLLQLREAKLLEKARSFRDDLERTIRRVPTAVIIGGKGSSTAVRVRVADEYKGQLFEAVKPLSTIICEYQELEIY